MSKVGAKTQRRKAPGLVRSQREKSFGCFPTWLLKKCVLPQRAFLFGLGWDVKVHKSECPHLLCLSMMCCFGLSDSCV